MNEPIDEPETAQMLGVKRSVLRAWRMKTEGPPFYRLSNGTVRYDRSEVAAWIHSRRVATSSTSHEAAS